MSQLQNPQIILIVIIVLLAAIVLILCGSVLNQLVVRLQKRKSMKTNRDDGVKGEARAKAYLVKNGFTILKEQAHLEQQMIVDGVAQSFTLRADFIVEKDGETAVVDAKNGAENCNLSNVSTRRQLLEYFVCYDVDKVYLYNSIDDKLMCITFADDTVPQKKIVSVAYMLLLFLVIELVIIVLFCICNAKTAGITGL